MNSDELEQAGSSDVLSEAVTKACKLLQAAFSEEAPRSLRWALTGAVLIFANPGGIVQKTGLGDALRDAAAALTALSNASDGGFFGFDD